MRRSPKVTQPHSSSPRSPSASAEPTSRSSPALRLGAARTRPADPRPRIARARRSTPAGSGLRRGDLVVGIVRRPDPVPCRYCAAGEWDMCRNGQYTERGIKDVDGYGSERFRIEPAFAVKIGRARPDRRARGASERRRQGVGAGGPDRQARPVAATMRARHRGGTHRSARGADGRQRGLEVHVFDRVEDGPKPQLVRDLGGTYHCGRSRCDGRIASPTS